MTDLPYVVILEMYSSVPVYDNTNNPGRTSVCFMFESEADASKHDLHAYRQAKEAYEEYLKNKSPNELKTLKGCPFMPLIIGYVNNIPNYPTSRMFNVPPFHE